MKETNPWITYRTRFLVQAKQLTTSLTFTDVLGRVHSGRKGDYLVESSDGVLRIAPRQIFEDIYVPLLADPTSSTPSPQKTSPEKGSPQPVRTQDFQLQELPQPASPPKNSIQKQPQLSRDRSPQQPTFPALLSISFSRKSPQSERRRRNAISTLRSL